MRKLLFHILLTCEIQMPTHSLNFRNHRKETCITDTTRNNMNRTHTQFTCQTHCNSHYEYAHRLPATQMHHYTHTNATTHPVTKRTTSKRSAEVSVCLMRKVLGRHQRNTAGIYATYTTADADVCIDRNLSSTLQTVTQLVYVNVFQNTVPEPPKVHRDKSGDKWLANPKLL